MIELFQLYFFILYFLIFYLFIYFYFTILYWFCHTSTEMHSVFKTEGKKELYISTVL